MPAPWWITGWGTPTPKSRPRWLYKGFNSPLLFLYKVMVSIFMSEDGARKGSRFEAPR
jgi:hypothetical protein